jgi:hypothetical protein
MSGYRYCRVSWAVTEYSNLTTVTKRSGPEPVAETPRRAGYVGVNFPHSVLYCWDVSIKSYRDNFSPKSKV